MAYVGMGKSLRIWYFSPGLLLTNIGREYATPMSVETAFMWTWLMTDLQYEDSKEGGVLVTWQNSSRWFTFSHLSVTDGVIHLLLKIKASQIKEMKNRT